MSETRRESSRAPSEAPSTSASPASESAILRARGFELARQARVFFGGTRLIGLQPADHRDQHLDFFFQAIDGFEVERSGQLRDTGHAGTSYR